MSEQADIPKKSNKTTIIIAIVAVLVIVNGIKWYLDYQEKQEMQTFYEGELETAKVRYDEISAELDEKILEIEKLGGDIEELTRVKEEVEAERDQLQRTRTANRKLIVSLRDKTEGYAELLRAKDKEIEELTALNTELMKENTGLKEDQRALNQSINELEENKQELEEKVSIASRLAAEEIGVFAVNARGKEREGTFRARQINNLKVSFKIARNDVAPIESKTLLLRVLDANGQVYFDVARGSGTFIKDGKEEFYTASQQVLFDNSNQEVTFLYDKGSEYNSGNHTVEIYTDGYLMGSKSFTVR